MALPTGGQYYNGVLVRDTVHLISVVPIVAFVAASCRLVLSQPVDQQ
jgi:hypothetical protein